MLRTLFKLEFSPLKRQCTNLLPKFVDQEILKLLRVRTN
jgi:hypothetical protein